MADIPSFSSFFLLLACSLETEQAQVQVDHLAAFPVPIGILQVHLALVGVAVGDVGHCHHVVLVAADTDLVSAAIDHVRGEFLIKEPGAIGKYFHDLFGDHISYNIATQQGEKF